MSPVSNGDSSLSILTDRRHYYSEAGRGPQYSIPEIEKRNEGLTRDQVDELDHRLDLGQVAAWSSAGDALATMSDKLNKVSKIMAALDPVLSNKSWDFTFDGEKLVVQGDDLSSKEKDFVSDILNAVPGLTESARILEQSSYNAYDINGSGSVHGYGANPYTGESGINYYKNVSEQLQGKVSFRHLLEETNRFVTNNGTVTTNDVTTWGRGAVLVMGSYLIPSGPLLAQGQRG